MLVNANNNNKSIAKQKQSSLLKLTKQQPYNNTVSCPFNNYTPPYNNPPYNTPPYNNPPYNTPPYNNPPYNNPPYYTSLYN